MVAQIYQTAASTDLKAYLAAWTSVDPLSGYGAFSPATSPYTQWAGGDEGGSRPTDSVLLQGNFTYGSSGDFVGTVDSLTFGDGLSGSAGTGFSVDTPELTIDLNGASAITAFDYAIYGLMGTSGTANPNYLYAYFDTVGTEQHGTSGDDVQYSFNGSDTFFSGTGYDTFVFDGTDGSDTIVDFDVADDLIDIDAWGAASFGALSVSWAYDVNTSLYDATITYNGNGNSISVQDIALNSLNSSNVLV